MISSPTSLPLGGYLRLDQILRVLPVSSNTLKRLVRQGKFPRPVELTPALRVWRTDAVQAWLAERDPAEALHSADPSGRASREVTPCPLLMSSEA
jgi:prophage regulatory protein